MSISNSESANQYYKLVNSLVDDYIDGHKIRPSKLSAYLKTGGQRFNRFLERNKLKEISGIDRILRDVIEDREQMERDGVITFESFNLFESSEFKISNLKECIYKGIEKADLKMEKIIADYFDINLGSIDIINSDKHKFRIEDWKNDDWRVVIYSDEDVDLIKSNLIEYLYDDISKREIELIDGVKIDLVDLIDEKQFSEKLSKQLVEDKLIKIITQCLGEDWSHETEFRGFHIFVC
jgi:hypothetical protein